MNNIFFPSKDWTPEKNNPFEINGNYGREWSMFTLSNDLRGRYSIRKQGCHDIFTLSVNPNYDDWMFRLSDFIEYETSYGRKIIVYIPEIKDPDSILNKV